MKILLDENLPHELRLAIVGHDVFTVTYLGWSGTKNGELLKLAGNNGFDLMITQDNGVAYQQNISELPLTILILVAPSNDIDDLVPLVPAILVKLNNLKLLSINWLP